MLGIPVLVRIERQEISRTIMTTTRMRTMLCVPDQNRLYRSMNTFQIGSRVRYPLQERLKLFARKSITPAASFFRTVSSQYQVVPYWAIRCVREVGRGEEFCISGQPSPRLDRDALSKRFVEVSHSEASRHPIQCTSAL